MLALGQTRCGTGGSNRSVNDLGVPECSRPIAHVAVTASGTGVGGIAALGASRCSHLNLIFTTIGLLVSGISLTHTGMCAVVVAEPIAKAVSRGG